MAKAEGVSEYNRKFSPPDSSMKQ
jgi:hypothetical protein